MDNILSLAYLGDAVYEVYIRKYLIEQGIVKVNNLQKQAIMFVSAKAQASFVTKMLEDNFLTNDEKDIFIRGRNHKSHSSPKNTDIITYKHATGFEAIIGYLTIKNKQDRILEIINYIVEMRK